MCAPAAPTLAIVWRLATGYATDLRPVAIRESCWLCHVIHDRPAATGAQVLEFYISLTAGRPLTGCLVPQFFTAPLVCFLRVRRLLFSLLVGRRLLSLFCSGSVWSYSSHRWQLCLWRIPDFRQLDASAPDCLQITLLHSSQPQEHVLYRSSFLVIHDHLHLNRNNRRGNPAFPSTAVLPLALAFQCSPSSSLKADLRISLMPA